MKESTARICVRDRPRTYSDISLRPNAIRTHLRPQVHAHKEFCSLTVIRTPARSRPQDHIRKELSRMRRGAHEDASFSPLLICTYVHNTNRVILRSTYRVQHCSVGFLQSNARSARQGRSVREPEQIIGGHVEKESQLEYGGGGGLLLPRFPITYACIGKPECACKGVLPQTALDAKFPKALAEYL